MKHPRCNVKFIVPYLNPVSETFAPYMSACVRKEGYGHTGDHVFLDPAGRPVQFRATEEEES